MEKETMYLKRKLIVEMANLSRSQVSRYLDRKLRQGKIAKEKNEKKYKRT